MSDNSSDEGAKRVRGVGKVTASTKEDILAVFVRLGGTARMAAWAERNLEAFYTKLYARLIPADINLRGRDGEPLPGIIMLPSKEQLGNLEPDAQASRVPQLNG